MILNIYNKLKRPLYFIVIMGMLLQVSQVANLFTPHTAKADSNEIYATNHGGSDATSDKIYIRGVPDGNAATIPSDILSRYVYGKTYPNSLTGTITKVEIAVKYKVDSAFSDDQLKLSYRIGSTSNPEDLTPYYTVPTNTDFVTYYSDVTTDRTWTFDDITNLYVYATNFVNGTADGNNLLVDSLWVKVTTADVDNTNIYISPTGNDTTGDGTALNPYLTIQKGIDIVATNGTVNVATGAYSENVNVNKTITLTGTNATVNAAVASTSVFNVTANSVNISGFTITGANVSTTAGIYLGDNVTLCNIHNNTLTGNGDGIWLGSGSNHNTLENNILSSNYQGFEVYHSSNNTFTNNISNLNTKYGFKIDSGDHNTFTSNTANSNLDKGFYSVAGDGGGSTNSIFTNNTANLNTRHGIHLIGSNTGATLTGNTFDSNGTTGVKLQDVVTNLDMQNNDIINNPTGIYIDVSVTDVSTWTVTSNNISGNTTGVSNLGTGALNAENNWWGSDDPDFTTLIAGDICTDPWKVSTGESSATATAPAIYDVLTNDTTPNLTWNAVIAHPDVAMYQVQIFDHDDIMIDDSGDILTNSFTTGTTLIDGAYTYKVRSRNAPNNYNWSEYSTCANLVIDTTAPIITSVTEGSYYNANVTPSFIEGTATLNGNPFISGTAVSAEGIYTLIVTDQAGNSTTVHFTIDKTVPTGTIKINGGQQITNSRNVVLTLSAIEEYQMVISNTDFVSTETINWINFQSPYSFELTEGNGIKTIYVKFKDFAGNISQTYTALIEYNDKTTDITQKPVNIGDNTITNGNIDLSFKATADTTMTFANYSDNPGNTGGFSAFGKYFDISAENSSAINFPVMIKIYFTQADLNSAGITDAAQIKGLYYWDSTSSTWKLYSEDSQSTTGVVITSNNGYIGYVWANVYHFTPMSLGADTTNPNKPANFKAEAGDTQIKLTWDKVSDATGYYVRYREGTNADADKVYTEVYISGVDNIQTTVSELNNDKMYEFGVQAVDTSGNKSEWAVVEETPKAGAVIVTASEASSLAKQLFGISTAYAAPSESTPQNQQEIKTNPENITDQGEVKSEESEESSTQSTRAAVTIGIIIIAIGAALGGYYGYQWWLSRDEKEIPPVQAPKKDYVGKDKVKDNSKGKQSRRW